MVLVRYIIGLTLIAFTMMSCNNEGSLQRYLVDKQADNKFVKVDLATSLLESNENNFTEEQREILSTVKKINVVAYPIKGENKAEYETERSKLTAIIDQEQYQTLTRFNSDNIKTVLKYVGDDETIDEVIIFMSHDERGFAIFRLLGDEMRPGELAKLMTSLERGDLDFTKLSGLGEVFDVKADSI
jgi:hypothetical protein